VSPPGEANGAQVIAWFYGEVGQDWSQIGMSANCGYLQPKNCIGFTQSSYSDRRIRVYARRAAIYKLRWDCVVQLLFRPGDEHIAVFEKY
jgi:hypothetical protein